MERGELRHAVLQVLLGHNGVPPVDTLRLVPGELHTRATIWAQGIIGRTSPSRAVPRHTNGMRDRDV